MTPSKILGFDKSELISMGIKKGNYPQMLYKYRTVEQAKLILDNNSFWFATPDSFNDPFDCELSETEIPSIDDARLHFERLGMAKTVVEKAIRTLSNKPDELVKLVKEAKDSSIRKKGVLSLSEKYDDILMWSHYAEYHTGVVIGLKLMEDLDFFVYPIKVGYQDKYDVLNYLKCPQESTMRTLKTKSSQWAYEKEIRIYKPDAGLRAIRKQAIKEIYFGTKICESAIKDVCDMCEKKGIKEVKFFRGAKCYGRFALQFEEL